jgi:NitT/TauT family transport system substrate-binding protein/putative hydroxymethylpyrimidine transport system substrate-binding protein
LLVALLFVSLATATLAACGGSSRSAQARHDAARGGASGASTKNEYPGLTPAVRKARPAPRLEPPPLARGTKVTLILDFTPNAVHAGIYRALAEGYYRRENIELQVVQPTSTEETLELIDAGKAQFGLADGSDVAGLIARGGDAKAVMALVQRPLGGLIALASEHLRSPADLQGEKVGITGVPSDTAVLDTEVRHAGGDPTKVHVVNVGFAGAQALIAGRIAAFTGFIPADGVGLRVSGHPITAFALDRNGGPPYPGLVAFTTRREIARQPRVVKDFVAATVHGYRETIADPAVSLRDLLAANPDLPRGLTEASLRVYLTLFEDGAKTPFGRLQAGNLASLSGWMTANRLIDSPLAPSRYGTNAFLP